jgi:hypothetical protein
MQRARACALLACACLSLSAAAGYADERRVLRIGDFGGDGLSAGEAAALRDLVTSYVGELQAFRLIDAEGQDLALREAETAVQAGSPASVSPLVADYVLAAEASKAGNLIVLGMSVTKVSTTEKRSVTDSFASVSDLILASRRLTRELFSPIAAAMSGGPSSTQAGSETAAPQSGQQAAATNPKPSLSLITGTWKGDKNIDRVSILPNGKGFAILSSGVRMAIKAAIEGTKVVVAQDQPNSPEFYRPALDPKSARIVSAAARPWRWVFSLAADGGSLSGYKETVFVSVTDKGAVSINNDYVREAAWTRLYK